MIPPPPKWLPYLSASYEAVWFSNLGPVVREFEAALTAKFCRAGEEMVSANSCTSAIAAVLIAAKVKAPVLLPAFTFGGTLSGVAMAGLEAHVLDVGFNSWLLDPELLEDALRNSRYGAVVLVLPFGIAADYTAQAEICARHGVPLLIDNAAGLGPLPPALSEMSFELLSLHATKPFAIGEGGAIRAPRGWADALHRASNFGLERGVEQVDGWGINAKLPEISAAVGLAVLEGFDSVLARRQEIARNYATLIAEFEELSCRNDVASAPWQVFPVLCPSGTVANSFVGKAATHSLELRRSYRPTLDHWERARTTGVCANARALSERIVCLPIYSDMSATEEEEIRSIVLTVARATR